MDVKKVAEDILSEFAVKIGTSAEQLPAGHLTIATRAAEYMAGIAVAEFAGVALSVLQQQTGKRALLNLDELQWTGRARAGEAMIEATKSVIERYGEAAIKAIIAAARGVLGLRV